MSGQATWYSQSASRPEHLNATPVYQYQTGPQPVYPSFPRLPSGQLSQPPVPHSANNPAPSSQQATTNSPDWWSYGSVHHGYAPPAQPLKHSTGPVTQRQGSTPQSALLHQSQGTPAADFIWGTNVSYMPQYQNTSLDPYTPGHYQTPSWYSSHYAGPTAQRPLDAQPFRYPASSASSASTVRNLERGREPRATYTSNQAIPSPLPTPGHSGEQIKVNSTILKGEQTPQANAHQATKRKRTNVTPSQTIASVAPRTAVPPTTLVVDNAPAGTQANPFVLDKSPEPKSRSMPKAPKKPTVKRQPPRHQGLDNALTKSHEPGTQDMGCYGMDGGNNPTVYTNLDLVPKHLTSQGSPAKRLRKSQESQVYVDAGPVIPATVGGASKSKTSSSTEPPLCKEQQDLVDLILSGRNVFYTGSAGCGKSTVLKAFVKQVKEMGKEVKILAPTGRAALAINGTTTWSYVGWVPSHHKKPIEELKKGGYGKLVQKRLRDTDVLIIDEISMVENHHLERINEVMKTARNSGRAFGGVQVIVTGDFCQLPPVKPFQHCITCGSELVPMDVVSDNKREPGYRCKTHGIYLDRDKWAFRSRAWEQCDFVHVNLTNIHRQSDKVFIDILQKLRLGRPLSSPDVELILNHPTKGVNANAVRLFGTRADCNRVNFERFSRLVSRPRSYKCLDDFKWNEQHYNLRSKGEVDETGSLRELNRNEHRYNSTVDLKQGMAVVLLANIDITKGLVNGAQGIIQGFEKYSPNLLPRAGNPTVGKAGMLTTPGFTPPGSRVLAGDYATYREDQIRLFLEHGQIEELPKVRFQSGQCITIYPDCSVNEYGDTKPYTLIARTQIPLTAGYAITTHKAQGMTLDKVEVDLSKTFEAGQTYVALSRARSLEGLKVTCFPEAARCSANPEVQEFLRERFPECIVE